MYIQEKSPTRYSKQRSLRCVSGLLGLFLLCVTLPGFASEKFAPSSSETSLSPLPVPLKNPPSLLTLSLDMHPIEADLSAIRQGYQQVQWLSEPPFTRRIYTARQKTVPLQGLELVSCQATGQLVEIRFQGKDRKALYALARGKSELDLREPPSPGLERVERSSLFESYQETYLDRSRLTLSAEGTEAALVFESVPRKTECRMRHTRDIQDMLSFQQEQQKRREAHMQQTF